MKLNYIVIVIFTILIQNCLAQGQAQPEFYTNIRDYEPTTWRVIASKLGVEPIYDGDFEYTNDYDEATETFSVESVFFTAHAGFDLAGTSLAGEDGRSILGFGYYQLSFERQNTSTQEYEIQFTIYFNLRSDNLLGLGSPDLTFKLDRQSATTIVSTFINGGISYTLNEYQDLQLWTIKGVSQHLDDFIKEIPVKNDFNGTVLTSYNITLEAKDEGFPGTEYSVGCEFVPGTNVEFWKGATYTFSVPEESITYNNVTYKPRHWLEDDEIGLQKAIEILSSLSSVTVFYTSTVPLTVTNNLEGGSGGTYTLTWTTPTPDQITDSINSGDSYNAFEYNQTNQDEYSIDINSSISSIYGQNWTFLEWSDGVTSTTRSNEQITSSNKNFTANFKSWNRTSNANTYSTNGQNKIAQTTDGVIHKVYESLGKVWYEKSTNNGSTWTIMNNGAPLNSLNAKNPAIAVLPGSGSVSFVIAYQVDQAYKIMLEYFNGNNFYQTSVYSTSIYQDINSNFSFDSQVAVSYSENLNVIATFKIPDAGSGSSLYCWYGNTNGGISTYYTGAVPNTNSYSQSPSIVSDKYYTPDDIFHLVWEQNGSIKYYKLTGNKSNNVSFSGYYDVSSALGYSNNSNPSIADYVDDGLVVSWITENPYTYIYVGALRTYYGGNWNGTTYTYPRGGDDVVSINSNTAGGVISAFGTSTTYGQYVKTSNLNYKYNQTYTGDVKVCNGSGYSDALLSTLVTSTAPYQFMHYGQAGLPKSTNENNAITREINIALGNNRIFIDLGNIEADGESIGFYDVDSLGGKAVNENNKLSNYLVSEGFDLTDNSEIYFDFGIEKLNENELSFDVEEGIDIKVVLLDDKTNEIISEIKNAKVKNKLYELDKKAKFKLNSDNKEKRRVKLALIIDGVKEVDINLVTLVGDGTNDLPKEGIEEINIETLGVVEDYNVMQNYPNPFNPTTTIKYELPGEGLVTIKVFDVLGKEVATLVNKKQDSGRYEITFNGEGLATGMYIYKIDVKTTDTNFKDFSSVKKMLLIK